MSRFLAPCVVLALSCTSAALSQDALGNKLQALEKTLSADQKQIFHEWVGVRFSIANKHFDPAGGDLPPTLPDVRERIIDYINAMTPEEAKAFWRDLPFEQKQAARELDPLYVSDEERKAAERLPAEAKEHVAKLLSKQIDEVVSARRKVLCHGPACRALVVAQLKKLPAKSAHRHRHEGILADLQVEEIRERTVRVTDAVLQKAAKVEEERARKKSKSTIGVMVSMNVCQSGRLLLGRGADPYLICHYDFLHGKNHDLFGAGLGLTFGNGGGNFLQCGFGGQENRLSESLGNLLKYENINSAPEAATTKMWTNKGVTAKAGHIHILHLNDEQVNFCVKFRILDMSSGEWIIFEWERIPQDNGNN